MASPSEKLANSLKVLNELQGQGVFAVRSSDLTRVHRERLIHNGFLTEVMKGWYIYSRPDTQAGDSTAWYSSFWSFCSAYLKDRFGSNWCLSPEQSLSLLVGNRTVPRQLLVRAPSASNRITNLPYETSLLDVRAHIPEVKDIEECEGMHVFAAPAAFVACSPSFFQNNPTDARTALATITNASGILKLLLTGGHSTIAGRLAGAFRNIGRDKIANDIIETMRSLNYDVREHDPFDSSALNIVVQTETSPYVNRIRLMWQQMRDPILEYFPKIDAQPVDMDTYLKHVDEVYVTDAYHSLSIEGYRVSAELIERVRTGTWNPDYDEQDRKHRNALAARGYWQAHQAVKESLRKIIQGSNPGSVVEDDHGKWYRELFAPSVTAGFLHPSDLAGYRSDQVFIRGSMHVPLSRAAVLDAIQTFFILLKDEPEPAVRTVLGHFIFVYIHPYMDGNGRIGRFLMNLMLASGGYKWTVIPVEDRNIYMAALEEASVRQNIEPFTKYLGNLVKHSLENKAVAKKPVR